MAKGIAGGFPFGALLYLISRNKLEIGDHGGTYCGNPPAVLSDNLILHHLNTFLYTIFNSAITHSIFLYYAASNCNIMCNRAYIVQISVSFLYYDTFFQNCI